MTVYFICTKFSLERKIKKDDKEVLSQNNSTELVKLVAM